MSYTNWVILAAVVMILTMSSATTDESGVSLSSLSKPGCPDKCGNISIPYPFGIGDECSYDYTFNITCNLTINPPFPTPISTRNLEVLNISLLEGHIRMPSFVSRICYSSSGELLLANSSTWASTKVPFTFSSTENMLVATGCDSYAWFTGKRSPNRYIGMS